jgi:CBS domain containing-hemolysin-like protein
LTAALPLFLAGAGGGGAKQARILLHLFSLQSFGVAGWLFARGGDAWLGGALIVFGFAWTGAFWIAAVRRRLAETPEITGLPSAGAEPESVPSIAGGSGEELEPQGRAILRRLLAMREHRIGAIATPREAIVFADCAGGVDEAVDRIRKTRHLRIPMVDGSLDRIVGIVHAKDIIPLAAAGRPNPPLKKLMRRPLFVSQDQTTAYVLEMFRSQRGHLAIVVDAYNRTLGLVSRDDLFRHLTGGSEAST